MFTPKNVDTESSARTGILHLHHGDVETPAFMPVGTQGTVKAISHRTLEEIGYTMILGNTYHLYIRPGTEVIENAGGLHSFSGWGGNILTDSGGYQVFSLARLRTIGSEGVRFQSHIDGAYHTFTPESVVDTQHTLGSDILMPLDVCTPPGIDKKDAVEALETTTEWARRSKSRLRTYEGFYGRLFGIIQGNFFPDLRKRSAEEINGLDFPGIAVGGLSVGEEPARYHDFLALTAEFLPADKPRYVMGIGTPEYVLSAVENGIDIFDCVFPTRIARNSSVFTRRGVLSLKKEENLLDTGPIDPECTCPVCRRYSRSYLRHLFKVKEILGPMLATEHNLYFFHRFMKDVRDSIDRGNFARFKREFSSLYSEGPI
jgi:queuine tRNA-ribosyltransferase